MGLIVFLLWLLIGAMAGAFIAISLLRLDPYDDSDDFAALMWCMGLSAVFCPLAIAGIILYVPLKWFVDFLLKKKPSK